MSRLFHFINVDRWLSPVAAGPGARPSYRFRRSKYVLRTLATLGAITI